MYMYTMWIAPTLPSTKLATAKPPNMVMLGAIIRASGVVSLEIMDKVLAKTMTGKKEKLIPANKTALSAWKE